MILNIYVYKGSKHSLIGPWVVAGYLNKINSNTFEELIPHKKSLFKQRSSLKKYDSILLNNLNICFIDSIDINTSEELAIFKAINKIKAYAISQSIDERDSLKVNIIKQPVYWYERLTVLCAVFYRQQYLLRISTNKINFYLLEHNLESHINLLLTYKYLPPIYILNKCMCLFKDVYPKPNWWTNEIKHSKKHK